MTMHNRLLGLLVLASAFGVSSSSSSSTSSELGLPPLAVPVGKHQGPQPLPSSLGGRTRLRSRLAQNLRRFYREAKTWTSSDFEAALLKSTRPDDLAPKAKHVESIVLSVSAFESFVSAECDPYALLLHKIWSRLVEPSPYTVAKAIYLYRRVLLGHPALFRARRQLARLPSGKSNTCYFDCNAVIDVQPEQGLDVSKWQPFLSRYWAYVDGAWLACSDVNNYEKKKKKKTASSYGGDDPVSSEAPGSYVSPKVAVARVVETAVDLVTLASTVLFGHHHGKKLHVPHAGSPLVDACLLQLVEDIYALHFVLLLCLAVDPLATFDAAKHVAGGTFWQQHRWTMDNVHPSSDVVASLAVIQPTTTTARPSSPSSSSSSPSSSRRSNQDHSSRRTALTAAAARS